MKKRSLRKIELNKRTISLLDADRVRGQKGVLQTLISCIVASDDPNDPKAICLDDTYSSKT